MKKWMLFFGLIFLFSSSRAFAHASVSSSTAHILEHLITGAGVLAVGFVLLGFAVRARRVRNDN